MGYATVFFTIFGQEKSAREWSEDRRCAVSCDTFIARNRRGWPPEAALVIPDTEGGRGHIAFKEKKTLIKWLTDPRCQVSASVLMKRAAMGWQLEKALTTPEPFNEAEEVPERRASYLKPAAEDQKREAFGEWKILADWARDDRCVVDYPTLKSRCTHGLPLEAAISFSHLELSKYNWCFGVRRRMAAWLKDSRCIASPVVIRTRMKRGEKLEAAMTRSNDEPRPPSRPQKITPQKKLERQFGAQSLTIEGETKTVTMWSKDARCELSYPVLYTRVRANWPRDLSILKESWQPSPFKLQFVGYTENGVFVNEFKTIKLATEGVLKYGKKGRVVNKYTGKTYWVPVEKPRRPRKIPLPRTLTGWGETKLATEWLKDERCVVKSLPTIFHRIDSPGGKWTVERALSTPVKSNYMSELKRLNANLYEAYGESKPLLEWSEDPRCELSYTGVKSRLRRGMSLEEAMKRERKRAGG